MPWLWFCSFWLHQHSRITQGCNICAVVFYIVESMLLSMISVLLMPIHSSPVAFICTLRGWHFRLKYADPDSLHHRVSAPTDRNSILRKDTQPT
ncbi:hypothetical protein BDV36DRAFT_157546 [Aspergillus pseudocaelatus]|uniref:Uncharacterized protein n=1 Tax=Aspergillus pseudocaelatus TaxID=1825620 RepID=A0ABQ6X1I9_9EURO|nr:hypothetical protein BDV36DRAFT_157546 [Aspergillus pseudocaelatus]